MLFICRGRGFLTIEKMNIVTLSGSIHTEEITLRQTPRGIPVTSFVLKTKREHKKDYELDDNKYDFITVVCWNQMAMFVVENCKFGAFVTVTGSIRTGRRKLKDYVVYKKGKEQENLQIPVFEIYAEHLEKR